MSRRRQVAYAVANQQGLNQYNVDSPPDERRNIGNEGFKIDCSIRTMIFLPAHSLCLHFSVITVLSRLSVSMFGGLNVVD